MIWLVIWPQSITNQITKMVFDMIWLVIGFDFNHMEKMVIWLGIWLDEVVIWLDRKKVIWLAIVNSYASGWILRAHPVHSSSLKIKRLTGRGRGLRLICYLIFGLRDNKVSCFSRESKFVVCTGFAPRELSCCLSKFQQFQSHETFLSHAPLSDDSSRRRDGKISPSLPELYPKA